MKLHCLRPSYLILFVTIAHSAQFATAKDDSAVEIPNIKLENVASGFAEPTFATWQPSKMDRLLIVEQKGKIKILEQGKVRERDFLDITDRVDAGGEKGLLSIAFHPRFPERPVVYANYTRNNSKLETVISEFDYDQAKDSLDPSRERVVLTIDQPYTNHNGGQIAFGPDGYLYIGMGDGGLFWDPHDYGQNMRSLLGKMLRVDVNALKYSVPKDNPFADGVAGAPEIWASGLRNPWRFSFDRKSGALWAGDVGQNTWEEIDLIKRGANYGWDIYEGTACAKEKECNSKKFEPPVATYGRKDGISVTGGYVYRGEKYPELQGVYLYGDWGSGKIWGLKMTDGGKVVTRELLDTKLNISSFAEDMSGELYVLDGSDGGLFKITLDTPIWTGMRQTIGID